MKPLSPSFFERTTIEVAKALLGCILLHKTKEGITSGKIVETEAYLQNDPASHSFKGKTLRNAVMFGPAGNAYVYFTYGMHYCFNVVTQKGGMGEAVLIRALEPLQGIELMKTRRGITNIRQLCNGPAKLAQALAIIKEHNGMSLFKGPLRICIPESKPSFKIVQTRRVGISQGKSLHLRFYVEGSEFVSRALAH